MFVWKLEYTESTLNLTQSDYMTPESLDSSACFHLTNRKQPLRSLRLRWIFVKINTIEFYGAEHLDTRTDVLFSSYWVKTTTTISKVQLTVGIIEWKQRPRYRRYSWLLVSLSEHLLYQSLQIQIQLFYYRWPLKKRNILFPFFFLNHIHVDHSDGKNKQIQTPNRYLYAYKV